MLCAKLVQSKTKNEFCKTKCVKLNFYKNVNFHLCSILSTVWIYHFHCFPMSFLLLNLTFTLILCIATLISGINHIFTHIPDPNFKKIVTLVQKRILPYCYYCITLGTKSLFTWSETSSVISPKRKITLKCLNSIICGVWANNYEWRKCYFRFMSKRSTTCPKISTFHNFYQFKKKLRN